MPVSLLPGVQRPGRSRTLLTGPEGTVSRTVLPSGLRIISEWVPSIRSVAFGMWVGVGSRDEAPSVHGASHFLEHLLFKGTRRRSALDIAAAIDAVGGEMNAFTAKEYTCFYARVLDTDLSVAVDVVSDMVTSSLIRTADVDNERAVVLEEIAMHDDDPGDVVHDELAASVWSETPLGRPILGTDQSIQAMSRAAVAGYYRRRYRPDSIVVAAAGNVDHGQLVRLVRAAIAGTSLAEGAAEPAAPRRGGRAPAFRPGAAVVRRPIEQAYLLLATRALARTDDRRFALAVLNTALGGGMSSRLFQEIREKRGLAYSVYSFTAQYADTGLFGVSVGCQPDRASEVLALARDQLAEVVTRGLHDDELARGKAQMRGGVVLGMEDTGSRMTRLGKAELVYGELLGVDELLARIDVVTMDDVRAVAADVLAGPIGLAAVGPFDDDGFTQAVA